MVARKKVPHWDTNEIVKFNKLKENVRRGWRVGKGRCTESLVDAALINDSHPSHYCHKENQNHQNEYHHPRHHHIRNLWVTLHH